jgi:hypothetical protein
MENLRNGKLKISQPSLGRKRKMRSTVACPTQSGKTGDFWRTVTFWLGKTSNA